MAEQQRKPEHGFTEADVQRMIDAALVKQQEAHETAMDTLRQQLSGSTAASAVPEHSGGPGTKISATWSLAEQQRQIALRDM